MSRTFEIDKRPHDRYDKLYNKSSIKINSGVSALVGCNGSGKTTLLRSIKESLQQLKVPVICFDSCVEDKRTTMSRSLVLEEYDRVSELMQSSEGESVLMNVSNWLQGDLISFLRHHKDSKEVWVLIDAIDSGLSIDNIVDLKKHIFPQLINYYNTDVDVHIVVTANTFEMCADIPCLDVRTGKYRQFKSYTAYKNFILRSKKHREVAIQRCAAWHARRGGA